MGITIADQYYLKAKGAMAGFCSDWEEACESISYALSYDENHCPSLCLLGKIQAEYLSDFTSAFENFDTCIAADINYVDVYPLYARLLIWADELDRAMQLITFARKIKSVDTAQLFWCEAYINEIKGNYQKSIQLLKQAKAETFNDNYMYFLDDELHRIRKKNKKQKKKNNASLGFNTLLD